jgi:succinyl-diaminopimelate desuccinylase
MPTYENNWLMGRGAADSKVAVSIFSHIAKDIINTKLNSNISFLFDCDEHTGSFGGIKNYINNHKNVKGVFIGYPGNYGIVSGSRGFYRVSVTFFGISQHSGTKKKVNDNAIIKAVSFVEAISAIELKNTIDSQFKIDPKLSITKIEGGYNYTVIPDKCTVFIDIRLTPSFQDNNARELVRSIAEKIDNDFNSTRVVKIIEEESWPAYSLKDDAYIVSLLSSIASRELNRNVGSIICGPSNIGNYLSTKNVDAICGFGVTYENLHAANEMIEIKSINNIYSIYKQLVYQLA